MGMGLVTGAHAPVEWHDTQATATKTAKAIKSAKRSNDENVKAATADSDGDGDSASDVDGKLNDIKHQLTFNSATEP